jgi:signal transduction histidine kinase
MTRSRLHPNNWPTTIKVPLVVVVLMVVTAFLISDRVLSGLSNTQQRHLEELTGAYLDGLSSSLTPHVLRQDIWEIFDQVDRAREQYAGLSAIYTIVATADNVVLAASDPRRFASQRQVPAAVVDQFQNGLNLVVMEDKGHAFVRRALAYQDRLIGWIYAEIDIKDLLAERRQVVLALILTNAFLTLLFAGAGYLAVRGMIRPLDVLAEHLDRGRGGRIEPIPAAKIGARHSEFGRLFRRYNVLVRALGQRERLVKQLAEEEKMASLGRLASAVAHEINNPLGGMLNAVDTMQRHGGDRTVRDTSLGILKRGLAGIRDVVRATLVTYKIDHMGHPLRACDLDDLKFLVRQEVYRRRLTLNWRNELPANVAVAGGPLRQATLNLLLNACAASPVGSAVDFEARLDNQTVKIAIADRGPGLPDKTRTVLNRQSANPAPPANDGGLGAWMVNRLVREQGGIVCPEPRAGGGTRIEILIPLKSERELRHVA